MFPVFNNFKDRLLIKQGKRIPRHRRLAESTHMPVLDTSLLFPSPAQQLGIRWFNWTGGIMPENRIAAIRAIDDTNNRAVALHVSPDTLRPFPAIIGDHEVFLPKLYRLILMQPDVMFYLYPVEVQVNRVKDIIRNLQSEASEEYFVFLEGVLKWLGLHQDNHVMARYLMTSAPTQVMKREGDKERGSLGGTLLTPESVAGAISAALMGQLPDGTLSPFSTNGLGLEEALKSIQPRVRVYEDRLEYEGLVARFFTGVLRTRDDWLKLLKSDQAIALRMKRVEGEAQITVLTRSLIKLGDEKALLRDRSVAKSVGFRQITKPFLNDAFRNFVPGGPKINPARLRPFWWGEHTLRWSWKNLLQDMADSLSVPGDPNGSIAWGRKHGMPYIQPATANRAHLGESKKGGKTWLAAVLAFMRRKDVIVIPINPGSRDLLVNFVVNVVHGGRPGKSHLKLDLPDATSILKPERSDEVIPDGHYFVLQRQLMDEDEAMIEEWWETLTSPWLIHEKPTGLPAVLDPKETTIRYLNVVYKLLTLIEPSVDRLWQQVTEYADPDELESLVEVHIGDVPRLLDMVWSHPLKEMGTNIAINILKHMANMFKTGRHHGLTGSSTQQSMKPMEKEVPGFTESFAAIFQDEVVEDSGPSQNGSGLHQQVWVQDGYGRKLVGNLSVYFPETMIEFLKQVERGKPPLSQGTKDM